LIILFDCASTSKKEIEDFLELLKNLKIEHKKILIVGNKVDLLKSIDRCGDLYNICVSCINGTGLENLKQEIFRLAEIVRVYTKSPTREADFDHPFTLSKGSKLLDLAQKIHYGLAEKFKYARLFKKDLRKPIIVGKDYILEDKDIIEIHS